MGVDVTLEHLAAILLCHPRHTAVSVAVEDAECDALFSFAMPCAFVGGSVHD